MSEAFTPLTVPEAIAAAHRLFDRADAALSIARAFDGVPHRELLSIVILTRQLDAIATAAAAVAPSVVRHAQNPELIARASRLAGLLREAGYVPTPAPQPTEAADAQS